MRKYDYTFLKEKNLPGELINVIAGVYSMSSKDQLRQKDYEKVYTELQKLAIVESVKGSNAIEGIVTTDERIKSIVEGNTEPLNHNEQEIAGYRDVLNIIHNNYQNLSLDERNILAFHKTLLSRAKPDDADHYKNEDNYIAEILPDGRRSVRFEPISALDTKDNMEQLILAYKEARDDSSINQLLLIPCVILDFLCIHPFKDGNGRMSRLLTLFLMYKNGFDAGKYISFEEQINKNKANYYEALRLSSIGWHNNQNNYMPFVENFLNTLFDCYKELDKRFMTVNSKKVTKTARIEATVLNSLFPLSKADICNILPDVSPTTVESVLGKMVKNKEIKKIGMFKNAKYIRNQ